MRILNSELMPNILLSDKTSIEYSNTDVTQMSHTGKMGIWGGGGGGGGGGGFTPVLSRYFRTRC